MVCESISESQKRWHRSAALDGHLWKQKSQVQELSKRERKMSSNGLELIQNKLGSSYKEVSKDVKNIDP